ncbi:hypothetical protein QOZ80_1BG0088170 [Eleusine coracana subsp. coracana]|nr:hypothetical protein QOZ80_1BG0088170 [Eleusine coracana subsp. coracana]
MGGRLKFRLSDMIPNAWFFKLRDMRGARGGAAASPRVNTPSTPPRGAGKRGPPGGGAPRKQGAWHPHRASHYYTPRAGDHILLPAGSPSPLHHHHHHHPKASDTSFPPLPLSPPRRSARRRHHHHRRRSVKLAAVSSVSSSSGFVSSSPVSTTAGCRCGRKPDMVVAPDTPPCRRDRFVGYSDDDDDVDLMKPTTLVSVSAADDKLDGKVITSATEIIIDLRRSTNKPLRPIVTKPARRETEPEDKHVDVLTPASSRRPGPVADQQSSIKPRRSVSSSTPRRLKTRANTPRISVSSNKKCKTPPTTARSPASKPQPPPPLAESFAVVKASRDPRRDFRESMEEMIAENGIRSAADLEDLLACYLALNAAEYHDLIVDVFERIWATLTDINM